MMDAAKALDRFPHHSHELDIPKALSGSSTEHKLEPSVNRLGQVGNAMFGATFK